MQGHTTPGSEEFKAGETPSFHLGDRIFTVDDVVDAASFRGELEGFWREFLTAMECENIARSEKRKPDNSDLQSRSEEFRYSHDLVTAEETEGWMNARGISPTEFQAYFVRRHWIDQLRAQASPPDRSLMNATAYEREEFRVHTLMSGAYEGMARRLCQREAIRDLSASAPPPTEDEIKEATANWNARLAGSGTAAADWLKSIERDESWLEDQIRLEAQFSLQCRRTVSPGKLTEALVRLRLSLLMFDYEVMEVDSHHAAREAYLTITLDGMAMEDLAHEHRFPYHRSRSYLEKVPEHLQQLFISCTEGDVIEPMSSRLQLIRVIQKTEPSLEDSGINKYIHRRILNDFLSELEARHVRWVLK